MGRCQLHAYVPLAELFGYTSELRNFTSGTASFSMEPSHYAPVKEELADLLRRQVWSPAPGPSGEPATGRTSAGRRPGGPRRSRSGSTGAN